ncbi:hypothetical protein ACG7TL_002393 [Trametes sanguinea]
MSPHARTEDPASRNFVDSLADNVRLPTSPQRRRMTVMRPVQEAGQPFSAMPVVTGRNSPPLRSSSDIKNTFTFKTLAIAALALFVPSALGVTVSYDQTYDNSGASLATVACSDGTNGLLTKGFSTFGSLPHFPNIGGAAVIPGWNSDQCGTCWQLTYNGKSINVLAIDHAESGFNIALEAMNTLTGGQAVQLGRVDATATQVAASQCGL